MVLGWIGSILLLGNTLLVANGLAEEGVVDWAQYIRAEAQNVRTGDPESSAHTSSSVRGSGPSHALAGGLLLRLVGEPVRLLVEMRVVDFPAVQAGFLILAGVAEFAMNLLVPLTRLM